MTCQQATPLHETLRETLRETLKKTVEVMTLCQACQIRSNIKGCLMQLPLPLGTRVP